VLLVAAACAQPKVGPPPVVHGGDWAFRVHHVTTGTNPWTATVLADGRVVDGAGEVVAGRGRSDPQAVVAAAAWAPEEVSRTPDEAYLVLELPPELGATRKRFVVRDGLEASTPVAGVESLCRRLLEASPPH